MDVDQATAESVNCAFVRLSTSVGIDKVIDMAQKLGMRPNVGGRQPVTSGRSHVHARRHLDHAARDGEHHRDHRRRRRPPRPGVRVEGRRARRQVVFDETGRPGARVLDPDVAHCEVSILHGPIEIRSAPRRARGSPAKNHGFGKTGTNDAEELRLPRRDARSRVVRLARRARAAGHTRCGLRCRDPEHDLAQLHDPGDTERTGRPVPRSRRRVRRAGQGHRPGARPHQRHPQAAAPHRHRPERTGAGAGTGTRAGTRFDTHAGPDAAAGLSARTHGHGRGGGRRRRRLGRRRTQRRYWPGIFGIVTPLGRFPATQLVTM